MHTKNPRPFTLIAFPAVLALLGLVVLFTVVVRASSPGAPTADWVVINTDDEYEGECTVDHCSLRQAIEEANDSPEEDNIVFDIPTDDLNYNPDTGQWTIHLEFPLPKLTGPGIRIDATRLGDCNSYVILDASLLSYGLEITGAGHLISGLVITNAQTHGVYIWGTGAQSNTIQCSYIVSNTADGVRIGSGASHNTIGPGNIIAGNGDDGVEITNLASHNAVIGSFIGIDRAGSAAWANGGNGVHLSNGALTNTIGLTTTASANVISGNTNAGVFITSGGQTTRGNVVQRNSIGVGATGAISVANQDGVVINDAPYNTIGPNNTISGNKMDGVRIAGGGAYSNTVKGNMIGTDPGGTTRLSNRRFGVWIDGESHHNIIGTSDAGNVISGNGFDGDYLAYGGIKIHGADHNSLCNNDIGTTANGSPLPNARHGVWLQDSSGDGAQYNVIGEDINASCLNIIAWNKGHGVYVQGGTTLFNTIGKINAIYGNDDLGIDNDQGGNTELTPPAITMYSASSSGYTEVHGTACPGCTVLVYSDDDGEGQYYETYTTAAATTGRFDWTGYPSGKAVTFLAIDGDGNTSEFSGSPVYLRLSIDDAQPHVVVNKLAGDADGPAGQTIVEYAAVIYGYDDTLTGTFSVDLAIPNNVLGAPTRVFYRDQDSAYNGTPTIGWSSPNTGTYRASGINLIGRSGSHYRRVVFRFGIPHGTTPMTLTATANLIPPTGRTVAQPNDWAKLRILKQAGQIIITNRTALYTAFSSIDQEVSQFLQDLYAFAQGPSNNWTPHSPIYYVDAYDANLANWDNTQVNYANETTANEAARLVDSLIEDWVEDSPFVTGFICTRNYGCHVNLVDPPFLLIAGDDFVVPLYREKDPTDAESDHNHTTSNAVHSAMRNNNYFFTDNYYADLGTMWDDFPWDEGGVELATGRLIGSQPSFMSEFLRNGQYGPQRLTTPPRAIVASVSEIDADQVATQLSTQGYDVINDTETPITVDTYGWSEANLFALMQTNYMLLHHSHHSSENGWCTPPGDCGGGLSPNDLVSTSLGLSTRIDSNNPVFTSLGCRSGLSAATPYLRTVATELANRGAAAVMASTGIAFGDFGEDDYAGGEEFLREFYVRAVRHPSAGVLSLGSALRWAKRYWDGHWSVDDQEEKTGSEYILYGVPWVTLYYKGDPTATMILAGAPMEALGGMLSDPQALGDNTYVITATFDASGYAITHPAGYDLVEVPGMELARDYGGVPVVPLAETELSLPTGGSLIGVEVIAANTEDLGLLNLPALEPGIPSYPDPEPGGYVDATYAGVYPPQDFVTRTVLMDGHWVARVYASPVSHNATTGQTTLHHGLAVRITYHLSNTVALLGLAVDPTDLSPGESFAITATLSNPTTDPTPLTGTLWIEDSLGQIVHEQEVDPFAVPPGGEAFGQAWALTAPTGDGAYDLYVELFHAGEQEVIAHRALQVASGRITRLAVPEQVSPGAQAAVELTFANRQPGAFDGEASLSIYDGQGVLVEMLSLPLLASGGSQETVQFEWDTGGRSSGTYVVAAQVTGGELTFGPMQDTLEIRWEVYLPLVLRNF